MEGTIDSTRLAFISYNGPKLSGGDDADQRTLIRQRAMRNVAETRKQRRDQAIRRQSLQQSHPTNTASFLTTAQDDTSISRDYRLHKFQIQKQKLKPVQEARRQWRPLCPSLSPPCSGLLVTENFSMLNLAPLTGLRVGVNTLSFFTKNPSEIAAALSTSVPGSQKFMSFIPSRYGEVSSLSHVADCIVIKLRQMLGKGNVDAGKNEILRLHVRALESIQRDLNDMNKCMSSETLCAVQLLGVFDLINNASARSWLCHAAGASKLIEHRGPDSFETEFDLALFTAQIGPIVTEAILENRNCFLTDEKWKHVVRTAILCDEYYADHSDIMVCLWTHLAWGPNHFKSTTDLISAAGASSPQKRAILIENLRKHGESLLFLTELLQSRLESVDHQVQPLNKTDRAAINSKLSRINPLEIQGTLILCRLMKSRLMFALAPAQFYDLEIESQKLAHEVLDLEKHLSEHEDGGMIGGLFVSQTIWIARATMETHDIWKSEAGKEGMLDRWRFDAWCRAMGRRIDVADWHRTLQN